jgi:phosphatidylglycerol---prolipoprotein diacylglyceryl transferase
MLSLAAWLHTLDPFLVRFSGEVGIRWYGLSYVLGFVIAFLVLRALAKRGLFLIPADRVGDAMLWLIGGTIVGGRLGYCLFYQPDLFKTFSSSFPFWAVFSIDKGGMASHGGMIGLVLACLRISRGWKDERGEVLGRCPFLHVMDSAALVAPFGVFLGRLANFINGELLGAIVSPPGTPGPWWSVQFPQELLGKLSSIPALQSPETASKLTALAQAAAPGSELEDGLYRLATHPSSFAQELVPVLSSRHPSQLYQALAEGVVLGAILWWVWRKPRSPGVVCGAFFLVYGVLRVVTEFWRLPDAQFAVGRPLGLSRGQWYSLPMIALGLGLIVYAIKSRAPKLGGWLTPRKTSSAAKP